jgi:hypothetical protein
MAIHRRAISLIGVTLLPELNIKVLVLTVAVLLTPSSRPVKNSSVNAEHSDLYGIKSVVKLSKTIAAGDPNKFANNNFWHSSSVVGKPTADGAEELEKQHISDVRKLLPLASWCACM